MSSDDCYFSSDRMPRTRDSVEECFTKASGLLFWPNQCALDSLRGAGLRGDLHLACTSNLRAAQAM